MFGTWQFLGQQKVFYPAAVSAAHYHPHYQGNYHKKIKL
jgi:hypothetical protein